MLTFIYVSIFQHKRVCQIYKEGLTYARVHVWERATNVHEIQRKLPTQKDFRGRVCGVNIVGKNRTNCNTWQAPLTGTTRACRQVPSSARERGAGRMVAWLVMWQNPCYRARPRPKENVSIFRNLKPEISCNCSRRDPYATAHQH